MGTELSIREEQVPVGLSLIDGPDPATAVAYARQVSGVIASVLEEGSGFVTIQNKRHITIEGWQTLAAMTGHTVEVEWSRPVEAIEPVNGIHAWEARAVVRDQSDRVVAGSTSMASPAERAPWTKAEFSVRSMSETRASSRALASRMRFIVTLAGFHGTPAEEMGGGEPSPEEPWKRRWTDLLAMGAVLSLDEGAVKARLRDAGVKGAKTLNDPAVYIAAVGALTDPAPGDTDEAVEGEIEEPSEPTLPGTEAPTSHPMDPED